MTANVLVKFNVAVELLSVSRILIASRIRGNAMPDIIQDAWTSASECRILMEQASDELGRSFFRKLATNWENLALHFEALAETDNYLKELHRSREISF
jgi:inorganic triphosphatase YgiF